MPGVFVAPTHLGKALFDWCENESQRHRRLGPRATFGRSAMLLVIAAFSRELAGLRPVTMRAAPGLRWVATVNLAGERAILVANGAGRTLASAAARQVLSQESIRAVISTGFAGALDPSYSVGDVFIATSVRGEEGDFASRSPAGSYGQTRRGELLTVNGVVQSAAAKRDLRRLNADAVDMEAASVAAVAKEHGLPFFCIRAISDVVAEDMPVDFNRALRADGSISVWSLLAQALRGRDRWSGLMRLHRNAKLAARSLGTCLRRCEFPCQAGAHDNS